MNQTPEPQPPTSSTSKTKNHSETTIMKEQIETAASSLQSQNEAVSQLIFTSSKNTALPSVSSSETTRSSRLSSSKTSPNLWSSTFKTFSRNIEKKTAAATFIKRGLTSLQFLRSFGTNSTASMKHSSTTHIILQVKTP